MWEFQLYGENIRHLQSLNSDGDDKFSWMNFCGTCFNDDFHFLQSTDAETHNIVGTSFSFHSLNWGSPLFTRIAFDGRRSPLLWARPESLDEEM